MTDLPPAASIEPRNPYERALWVAGAALILASIAANVLTAFLFRNSYTYTGGSVPVELIVAQVVSSVAPGALTGGLGCGALALAIRGIRFDRDRRSSADEYADDRADDAVQAIDAEHGGDRAHAADVVVRSQPARLPSGRRSRAASAIQVKPQSADYTMFMRPEESEEVPAPRAP